MEIYILYLTYGAGEKRKPYKKRENIVEVQNYVLNDDEKQIIIDGELVPYSINIHGQVKNLKTGKSYAKVSVITVCIIDI